MGETAPPTDSPITVELPADPEAVERGREGRFRIGVVTAYDYTVITADRHFAESGDAALLLTAM